MLIVCSFFVCDAPDAGLQAATTASVAALQAWCRVERSVEIISPKVTCGREPASDNKTATARRRIEGGDEMVEMSLPALVTCEKGLNEPRYASLPGIMKAKKKEIKKVGLAEVGFKAESVGAAGSKSKVVRYHNLPDRPPVKMIAGDAATQAKELVRLLREEAKVI